MRIFDVLEATRSYELITTWEKDFKHFKEKEYLLLKHGVTCLGYLSKQEFFIDFGKIVGLEITHINQGHQFIISLDKLWRLVFALLKKILEKLRLSTLVALFAIKPLVGKEKVN